MSSKTPRKNINRKIRKTLGYSIIAVYALIVVLIFIALKPKEILNPINLTFIPAPTSLPTPTPTPIPTPTATPMPTSSVAKTVPTTKTITTKEKNSLVTKLLYKLPYKSNYFLFYFDYKIPSFVLYLNKNSLDEANKNFDAFLQENGIKDRTYFSVFTVREVEELPVLPSIYGPPATPVP